MEKKVIRPLDWVGKMGPQEMCLTKGLAIHSNQQTKIETQVCPGSINLQPLTSKVMVV